LNVGATGRFENHQCDTCIASCWRNSSTLYESRTCPFLPSLSRLGSHGLPNFRSMPGVIAMSITYGITLEVPRRYRSNTCVSTRRNGNLQSPDGPSGSAVRPRLVPRDGVDNQSSQIPHLAHTFPNHHAIRFRNEAVRITIASRTEIVPRNVQAHYACAWVGRVPARRTGVANANALYCTHVGTEVSVGHKVRFRQIHLAPDPGLRDK